MHASHAGNACWGGDATHVSCNGPNEDQMDVELFHRKAHLRTCSPAALQPRSHRICNPASAHEPVTPLVRTSL